MIATRPLSDRERRCLEALVVVHQESNTTDPHAGLLASVTSSALAYLTGEPWAGSLSALVERGLVQRLSSPEGISYRVTEAGWAKFAGVEVGA